MTKYFFEAILGVAICVVCFMQVSMALELDYGRPKKFKTPYREVAIIVTEEGYYPEKISVFQGEKVRFFITSTTDIPGCLIMPDKEVFLSARKGKVSETEVYFEKDGRFKFYCPSGKMNGHITAIRKESQTKQLKRTIASEPRVWMPRNE